MIPAIIVIGVIMFNAPTKIHFGEVRNYTDDRIWGEGGRQRTEVIREDTTHQPTRARARVGNGHKVEREPRRDALCRPRRVDIREYYTAKTMLSYSHL